MAEEFKIISTQEELDAVIGDRLRRERESSAKKYEGWTSPDALKKLQEEHASELAKLQEAAAASQKVLEEKDAEIQAGLSYKTELEKTRIALEAGLPVKYATRLVGDNADAWKADAEAMAKDFAPKNSTPLGTNDSAPSDGGDAISKALGKMAKEALK